jgi:hypothetical protein
VIVGLAGWIGATIAVAARQDPGQADDAARTAFVIGGAVFFGVMFGAAAFQMRRIQRRTTSGLYERLALRPLAPGTLRRATKGLFSIGYVYVLFGVVVTAIGLIAIGVGDDTGKIIRFVIPILGVWTVYAVYATRKAFRAGDDIMSPLGLQLTGIPEYRYSIITDRGWLTGAMTYAGRRHGREVSITQTPKQAVTVVEGDVGRRKPPTTPKQMADLTGESIQQWRKVEVAVEDGAVIVVRRRNGAGGWFLHDLLLAEAVAAG